MQIIMHSKKPLPNEIRGTFELPVWPYRNGPGADTPHEFRDYLKALTVFRYQDDYFEEGTGNYLDAILIPDEDGVWPHQWEGSIKCFEHQLWVDSSDETFTLKIIEWPNDRSEGHQLHDSIKKATGDSFAWGSFNKSVEIFNVRPSTFNYVSGHNRPGNISKQGIIKQ